MGVELVLEGYGEVGGHLDPIFVFPLFTDPNIFSLPEICLPFNSEQPNVCPFIPDTDDEEDYEITEGQSGNKRDVSTQTRGELSKRQVSWWDRLKKRDDYFLACEATPKTHSIVVEAYPSPTQIVAETTSVPVLKPGIPGGCTGPLDCAVDKWTMQRIPSTPTAIAEETFEWAGEYC